MNRHDARQIVVAGHLMVEPADRTAYLVDCREVVSLARLAAGCLDRLHVTVAPVLLGSGIPAFTLPEAARIADGLRFAWTVHAMPPDVLFDIALDRARPGVCG